MMSGEKMMGIYAKVYPLLRKFISPHLSWCSCMQLALSSTDLGSYHSSALATSSLAVGQDGIIPWPTTNLRAWELAFTSSPRLIPSVLITFRFCHFTVILIHSRLSRGHDPQVGVVPLPAQQFPALSLRTGKLLASALGLQRRMSPATLHPS